MLGSLGVIGWSSVGCGVILWCLGGLVLGGLGGVAGIGVVLVGLGEVTGCCACFS